MAKSQSTRRKSTRKRPSPDQVQIVRRMAEDTERVYRELPGDDEEILNAHVQLWSWLRQFDNGVYADDPAPIGYSRRW